MPGLTFEIRYWKEGIETYGLEVQRQIAVPDMAFVPPRPHLYSLKEALNPGFESFTRELPSARITHVAINVMLLLRNEWAQRRDAST